MRSLRRSPTPQRFHDRARGRGVSRPLYGAMRGMLVPPLRIWFRMRIAGAENNPAQGAAIIAPNHKSFLDAFFIAAATRRKVRYMAKIELFPGPLGWLFARLGAFPVRRGESDVEAITTARTILEQGGIVVMFPEGTRVEHRDALGAPHHGAGRLAIDAGVPIVPAAIAGTERLWLGPFPKPRRVQVTFLPAIDPRELDDHPDAVADLIERRVWPQVQREYGNQLARPGVIVTALTALGLGAGLLARRQANAHTRIVGIVPPGRVRRRAARGRRLARLRELVRR